MERRTFIKSVVAAFTSTAVFSRVVPTLSPVRWELFTNNYTQRNFDLTSPFFSLGKTVATDGRVLISVDDSVGVLDGDGRFPDVSFLAWDEFSEGGFQSCRNFQQASFEGDLYCPDCLGIGFFGNLKVHECDVFDDWEECKICSYTGWIGDVPCVRCNHTGYAKGDLIVAGDATFDPGLIGRLKTLGEFDWKVLDYETPYYLNKNNKIMLAQNDRFKGFLMNVKPLVSPAFREPRV